MIVSITDDFNFKIYITVVNVFVVKYLTLLTDL